jgi:hypothetical protein
MNTAADSFRNAIYGNLNEHFKVGRLFLSEVESNYIDFNKTLNVCSTLKLSSRVLRHKSFKHLYLLYCY